MLAVGWLWTIYSKLRAFHPHKREKRSLEALLVRRRLPGLGYSSDSYCPPKAAARRVNFVREAIMDINYFHGGIRPLGYRRTSRGRA